MNKTNIQYMTHSWNPTHGCSPISDGCRSCWANIMAKRLAGMGARGYLKEDPFKPTFCPWELDKPLRVKKPSVIGVSFMGDLFHEDILDHQINSIFLKMVNIDWHTYLVLTKRPERMADFVSIGTGWRGKMPHVYLGVSCENQARADERISTLLQIPAAKRFVSLEPLLGPVDLKLRDYAVSGDSHSVRRSFLSWIIAGCESGPNRRQAKTEWFRELRIQCVDAGIPFFLKQMEGLQDVKSKKWGMMVKSGVNKMPYLDGQIWDQMP